jgi:hypothetical protein
VETQRAHEFLERFGMFLRTGKEDFGTPFS